MRARLFVCPTTRMQVQRWLDDDEDLSDNEFKAITCPASGRLHLINRKPASS
jgi:hypothetical protein